VERWSGFSEPPDRPRWTGAPCPQRPEPRWPGTSGPARWPCATQASLKPRTCSVSTVSTRSSRRSPVPSCWPRRSGQLVRMRQPWFSGWSEPTSRRSSAHLQGAMRCDDAPGDFIGERPVSSLIHPAGLPINTSTLEVLRRPVESARCRIEPTALASASRNTSSSSVSLATSLVRPGRRWPVVAGRVGWRARRVPAAG
jgi:hypothetical protein